MPTSNSKNKRIGITMGDPGGIGPEIIAKALNHPSVRRLGEFIIIGDWDVFCRFQSKLSKAIRFMYCPLPGLNKFRTGEINKTNGLAALRYLDAGIELVRQKEIQALVTAPLNKQAVQLNSPTFEGHTEYLAQAFKTKQVGMMFVAGQLRTIIVTRHIPIHQVSKSITKRNVLETIVLTNQSLQRLFKIKKPRIGVCGLNPHAGEGGSMGQEEIRTIIPVIKMAVKKRIDVGGPFAADTLFAFGQCYDAVVAMYHDQGLIPVKIQAMNNLVNLTVGLPFIRTSPAHGTAFDIAGKNKADPSSMIAAIKLAAQLAR